MQSKDPSLGKHHPSTALSLCNMAGVYRRLGEYGKAQHVYRMALNINKQALGKKHPETATVLSHMAVVLRLQV